MPPYKPAAPPHPHVTVDDVWRGALPKETQLVAGAADVERAVQAVHERFRGYAEERVGA